MLFCSRHAFFHRVHERYAHKVTRTLLVVWKNLGCFGLSVVMRKALKSRTFCSQFLLGEVQ